MDAISYDIRSIGTTDTTDQRTSSAIQGLRSHLQLRFMSQLQSVGCAHTCFMASLLGVSGISLRADTIDAVSLAIHSIGTTDESVLSAVQ